MAEIIFNLLTLDIWGSSVRAFLEVHLRHQTAPGARQQLVGVTWKGRNNQMLLLAHFMEFYCLIDAPRTKRPVNISKLTW